jgi:hypothetical protein
LRSDRAEDRVDRIEERQVDHLPGSTMFDCADRRDHGEGAIQAGDHVGQRERWQNGRAVRISIHRGKA